MAGDEGARPGSNGPDQAALTGAAASTDWLLYTHDNAGTRYSPLAQIDATNAARLVPACVFQLGETDSFQTGPLVHQGTMYLTTRRSTIALDAASCRPKWRQGSHRLARASSLRFSACLQPVGECGAFTIHAGLSRSGAWPGPPRGDAGGGASG